MYNGINCIRDAIEIKRKKKIDDVIYFSLADAKKHARLSWESEVSALPCPTPNV